MIWHLFFQPFIEYGFMRRALVVCGALRQHHCAGCIPSAASDEPDGDALSHAILPGVAVGYLLSGMSLLAMTVGGFIAGIAVALVAGLVSRRTPLKEDASFAGFYGFPGAGRHAGVAARFKCRSASSSVWLHSRRG